MQILDANSLSRTIDLANTKQKASLVALWRHMATGGRLASIRRGTETRKRRSLVLTQLLERHG